MGEGTEGVVSYGRVEEKGKGTEGVGSYGRVEEPKMVEEIEEWKKRLVAGGELRISRRDGGAIVRRSGFSREGV